MLITRKLSLLFCILLARDVTAAPTFAPGSCIQDKADQCLDATPCKEIGGITACLAGATGGPPGAVMLAETCWQRQAAFTCSDGAAVDSCAPLRERGCAQVDTQCVARGDDGRCTAATQSFQCPDRPPVVTESTVCDTAVCQADGSACFTTTRPDDRDFGAAAAMMEASREAGVYGVRGGTVELFKGYADECSVKVIGGSTVRSCCASAGGGGAYTNYAVIGLAAKAAYAVGKEELGGVYAAGKAQFQAGSKYVYDALFQSQDAALVKEGASAAAGGLTPTAAEGVAAQAGTTFGTYGFQFSYSSAGGFGFVGFDPASFAFSVAVTIVSQWLACDQGEQVLQMKRGQNLCVYLGSYCATRVLGTCVEKKEKHCCFNSVLARLINRQGRAQLGMPMDQCGGFSQDQLQALDFSRIDFSEFIASIAPVVPDASAASGSAASTVQQKVRDYYHQ